MHGVSTGLIWGEEEKNRELKDGRMEVKFRREDEGEGEEESKYGDSLGEKRKR